MIESTIGGSRVTAQLWTKALARAINEALDVLIEPISGEAFVESATRPGVLYQVSATTCTCPAGLKGVPCKHRACYLAQIGEIPLESVVIVSLMDAPCTSCTNGKVEEWCAGHVIGCQPCPVCGGTRRVPSAPTQLPEPQQIPYVAA